jgi:tRNA(Ile)-lysidine synthase
VQDTKNRLNIRELAAQPAALRSRIVRQWIEHTAQSHDLGFDHLEQVCALAKGCIHGMSGIIALPGSSQVRIGHGYLIIEPKQGQYVSEPYAHVLVCGQELSLAQIGWRCTLSLPRRWSGTPEQARMSDPWITFFDAAALSSASSFDLSPSVPPSVIVRSVRPGDRILPLGMAGHKKIQDVFVDAKLPRHLRQVFPLIVLEITTQEIAWVPGHVRGKQALVTSTTCEVCQFEVSPLPEKPELC